jgi:hypothetical protein
MRGHISAPDTKQKFAEGGGAGQGFPLLRPEARGILDNIPRPQLLGPLGNVCFLPNRTLPPARRLRLF